MNIYKKSSLIIIGITLLATTAQTVTNILIEAKTVQSYIDCPLTLLYDDKSCSQSIDIVKENVTNLVITEVPEAEKALKLLPLKLLPLILYKDLDDNEE